MANVKTVSFDAKKDSDLINAMNDTTMNASAFIKTLMRSALQNQHADFVKLGIIPSSATINTEPSETNTAKIPAMQDNVTNNALNSSGPAFKGKEY